MCRELSEKFKISLISVKVCVEKIFHNRSTNSAAFSAIK